MQAGRLHHKKVSQVILTRDLSRSASRNTDPAALVAVVKQVGRLRRSASRNTDPASLVEVVKQVERLSRPALRNTDPAARRGGEAVAAVACQPASPPRQAGRGRKAANSCRGSLPTGFTAPTSGAGSKGASSCRGSLPTGFTAPTSGAGSKGATVAAVA